MVERVELRQEKETLLMTLYLRACDSQARHPVLGDPYAQGLVERIDYDFDRLARLRGNTALVASRARQLDTWTVAFLAAHPDGLVLHLGCGLDSRPLRIPRPASAAWIDVDYPEVIALQRRLCDLPDGITTIATSVTALQWWDQVPTGRPTLVLAEGLFMYLPGAQVHQLIDRVIAHLPEGHLAFDGVARWVTAVARLQPAFRRADTGFDWALTSPQALADQHPGLRLVDEVSVAGLMSESYHNPLARTTLKGLLRFPAWRNAMHLVQYRFTH
jgi:O-methyltransferase